VSDASRKVQENQRYVMGGINPNACGEKLQQLASWESNSVAGSAGCTRAFPRSPSCSQVTPSVRQKTVFSTLESFWTWLITASVMFPNVLLLQEHLWVPPASSNANLDPRYSDAQVTTPVRAASEPQPHAHGAAQSPLLKPARVAARDPGISSSWKVAPRAVEWSTCTRAHQQSSPGSGWERGCVMNPPRQRSDEGE